MRAACTAAAHPHCLVLAVCLCVWHAFAASLPVIPQFAYLARVLTSCMLPCNPTGQPFNESNSSCLHCTNTIPFDLQLLQDASFFQVGWQPEPWMGLCGKVSWLGWWLVLAECRQL